MQENHENSQIRPGIEIHTDRGKCTLLYPARPGHAEGDWVCLLENGKGIVLTQEEINAALDDGCQDK